MSVKGDPGVPPPESRPCDVDKSDMKEIRTGQCTRRDVGKNDLHIRRTLVLGVAGVVGVYDRICTTLDPHDTIRSHLSAAGDKTLDRGNSTNCRRVDNVGAMHEIANRIMTGNCRI
jgi:hypothetical protein